MTTMELRDLLAKAKPGPREWDLDKYGEDTFDGNVTVDVTTPGTEFLFHADSGTDDFVVARACPEVIEAQLLVAAVNALPSLLDALDAARGLLEALDCKHGSPCATAKYRAELFRAALARV